MDKKKTKIFWLHGEKWISVVAHTHTPREGISKMQGKEKSIPKIDNNDDAEYEMNKS